jgi:predicted amidohydrolase
MDELDLTEISEHGQDSGRGNLLGMQPYMRREDYASEAAFEQKIRSYFVLAQEKGRINARTVAVLPEYTGTWLVTAGEHPSVYTAATIAQAVRPIVLRHLGPFLLELARAKESDRASAALFRVKAERMAQIYHSVFARLARTFGLTIAAGSIVLPDPRVIDGAVRAGKGALYNTAFLFHPDGRADARFARKLYPIEMEKHFTTPNPAADLPVFDTPAGKLGVLVCADSWYPEAYQQIQAQGAELIAVPSASSHGEMWEQPWLGYNGRTAPADVDPSDVGRLTEGEAWGKYALAGRIGGARAGINVFLYGELWDLAFDGGLWRMVCGTVDIEGRRSGPALINLWL